MILRNWYSYFPSFQQCSLCLPLKTDFGNLNPLGARTLLVATRFALAKSFAAFAQAESAQLHPVNYFTDKNGGTFIKGRCIAVCCRLINSQAMTL